VLRFVSDEDFDAIIVRGLLRRLPDLDLVSVREIGLSATADATILEWAAREGRVLLTHDVNTMVGHADERVRRGDHHAGVIKVPQSLVHCHLAPEVRDRPNRTTDSAGPQQKNAK